MQAILIDFMGVFVFCLQNTPTKCRDLKPQIFLCTQRGALFYPTVGPIIIRSRWGPSIGQQGPTLGTKNISHLMQQNTS